MIYRVQITDEVDAASPREALAIALDRLTNEETIATITHLATGDEWSIECTTGEVIA